MGKRKPKLSKYQSISFHRLKKLTQTFCYINYFLSHLAVECRFIVVESYSKCKQNPLIIVHNTFRTLHNIYAKKEGK